MVLIFNYKDLSTTIEIPDEDKDLESYSLTPEKQLLLSKMFVFIEKFVPASMPKEVNDHGKLLQKIKYGKLLESIKTLAENSNESEYEYLDDEFEINDLYKRFLGSRED